MNLFVRIFFFSCCFLLAPGVIWAEAEAEKHGATDEDQSFDGDVIPDFLELLDEVSESASESRLNVDYVPGMMTVLWGEDLEVKGVRTVYEALALVPGLNLSMESYGVKKIIVRGLGDSYATASLKLLLNGVSMNNALNGTNSALYDIPIEQIERIEIVRGPGAVLFGENAYAGVINVETRKSENKAFVRVGSDDTYGAGGIYSYRNPEKQLDFSMSLSGWDTNGAEIDIGSDRLTSILPAESLAPSTSNEAQDDLTGVLNLEYHDLSIIGQYTSINMADHFGFGLTVSEPDNNKVQQYQTSMLESGYGVQFNSDLQAEMKLGWKQFVQDWDAEILVDYTRDVGGIPVNFGISEDLTYTENYYYGGLDFFWTGFSQHNLRLGLLTDEVNIDEAYHSINGGSNRDLFPSASDRRHSSGYIQDEYEITDRLTLTAGLRYDTYSDVGDNTSPRVAAVYRLKDRHIFKAQYANAFRPPTFDEMYGLGQGVFGSQDISPETIDTYEAGYIYKGLLTDLHITLFYSELEDLIISQYSSDLDAFQYSNIANASMEGVEVEVEQSIGEFFKVDANISYITTEEEYSGDEIPGNANWLGNLGGTYSFSDDMLINLQYRYVGKRYRLSSGTASRDKCEAYGTVDLTASFYNVYLPGLTLRSGLTNLFDEDVKYPAPVFYEDDFMRDGFAWWAQCSYAF